MKTLTKIYEIHASAEDVYNALTKVNIIKKWSGSEAEMDLKPGGEFSLWDGSIIGINRSISKTQLVQDWKEENWGRHSRVTFNISEKEGITLLELIHEGIPEKSYDAIDDGWDAYYLKPLKELLEEEDEE